MTQCDSRRTLNFASLVGFATVSFTLLIGALPTSADEVTIDYIRDIRPILSDKCYHCHGPDKKHRKADLRLDRKESALGEAESGEIAVVPGKPSDSELIRRILNDDEDERMPPAKSGKKLTPQQKELLSKWIEQGANWEDHWAFGRPQRVEPPTVKDKAWPRNSIDHFVLAKLETARIAPSSAASQETLVRRVTFDLTGLPPTTAEVDAFLADKSPEDYERLVDRLLASPRYGEQMARFWLDAVRYGDTHGLHLDNYREMWPYRDWVVRAFNSNMPFDQFTIEQIAGDLLDGATVDQQVASGFNRCHVTTGEGGSIVEEVYVRNVIDRVVTTGTVFMGLTLECTRCHDHKYDPLTMKDFYSMFAFFNSLDGDAMDGNKKDHAPVVRAMTPEIEATIKQAEVEMADVDAAILAELDRFQFSEPAKPNADDTPRIKEIVWIDDALPAGVKEEGGWQFVDAPAPLPSGSKASTQTATGLGQHFFSGAAEPLDVNTGDVLFAYVFLDPKNPPQEIMLQWHDGAWEHRAYWGGNHIDWGANATGSRRHFGPLPETGKWTRLNVPVDQVGLAPGARINGWAFTQFDGTVWWDKAGIVSTGESERTSQSLVAWEAQKRADGGAQLPADVAAIVKTDPAKRDQAGQRRLLDYYIEHVFAGSRDIFAPLHSKKQAATKRAEDAKTQGPTSLVFKERKEPRPAFILNRGEYEQRGDQVQRETPGILPPMPAGAPLNRVGFAQWLVDPGHPLTARVTVNRFWQQVFGVGLVKTSENFGSQGEVPSHPELLDWLAVQFIDDGWDIKATMKRVVMSATYRQSSHMTRELIRRDPENRLLARGPRYRLDVEMLRDQALSVSGLLVNQLGGPSVKPPQPDGLWFAVGYSGSNTVRFKADSGPDKVHRRTLYTFIKRTAPPPQMTTFDAPSRESCSVRRERTNTPLQALLLMNDPQFFEAARALAGRTLREGGDTAESRAAYMFRLCTAREANSEELSILTGAVQDQLAEFKDAADAADKVIKIAGFKADPEKDVIELAAWTMVANLVLNLDEVVNKN